MDRASLQIYVGRIEAKATLTRRMARELAREISTAPVVNHAMLLERARMIEHADDVHRDDLRILVRKPTRFWERAALVVARFLVDLVRYTGGGVGRADRDEIR